MFFSVIVPIYKVEEYLPSCIESILAQTFSDFELILVNDGSPDSCPQICEEYTKKDSRIRVLHKPNGGLASARRAGIPLAKGEYVLNLDSDDRIEKDTLEEAHRILCKTNAQILSFAYRWVDGEKTVSITDDGLEEGFYSKEKIREKIYPRILMDQNMNHVSYYLSGKVIKRELLLPHQLNVKESISLGEDLCCVLPCYLNAESVYISKKAAYLYTVRPTSLSKAFHAGQIGLVENVMREISTDEAKEKVPDFEKQLCRYSCFMCFAVLATAAEGNHFKSIGVLKRNILQSVHGEKIALAEFQSVSKKSKICIFLMKKRQIALAFYFLNLCKNIKKVWKKR